MFNDEQLPSPSKIVKIEVMSSDSEADEEEETLLIGADSEELMLTPKQEIENLKERTETAISKVFNNDMLRDAILGNVINPVRTDRKIVCNLRLVQKSWLQTVGDIFRKRREYLFRSELNNENSVDGTSYCNQHGKALRRLNTILDNAFGFDQVPTFSLQILPEFFTKENQEDLDNCLSRHGPGLTELDIAFPSNGSSMMFTFNKFILPKLGRLSIQFTDQRIPEASVSTLNGQYLTSPNSYLYPLQTILHATSELVELQFKFTTSETLIPYGFDSLKLPKTIKYLFMDCPVKNQDMELLLLNELPDLRHLRLFGTNNPYAEGLIYQILSKFRTTVKTLNLRGSHYQGRVRNTTLFRLPIMEKLETFTITSQVWELEENPDHPINWDSCLPNLKEMRMLHQTETLFRKWTAHSRYDSVKRLFVSLINTNISGGGGYVAAAEHPLNFNLERMQALHLAFPNVVCLEISVCGNQTCGLKYMFMEMRNLQKLAITLKGNPPENSNSLHHWDALLIGMPNELVNCLKKSPDFWVNFDLKDDTSYPSMRKLTDLRSLALVEHFVGSASTTDTAGMSNSLISDLTFHFAFLKMQKLKHLLLSGRFKASQVMTEKWRKQKGTPIHSLKRFP